jgi:uncharacterized membrane protein YdjX (TVP38/TMEM64 family)
MKINPEKTTFTDKHRNIFRISVLLLVIIASFLIYLIRDKFSIPKQYGYFGIFIVSIISNATIILPVPTILTAYLAGNIFNPFYVGLISALGAAIGEVTGYLAGRGGSMVINNRKIYQKIESAMQKYGLWTIFVLAVIPNPFFDLAGIAAGITKIPFRKYFLITWAGKTVKFIFFALLGDLSLQSLINII